MSLCISAQAIAPEKPSRTLRVGYVYVNGFFQKNDGGGYTGFGYELLQEIAMYTGWEYSYVEGTLTDCLSMLERGELDLLMPLQKTPERAARYNYSAQPVCKNRGGLLALSDAPFYYRDYPGFQTLRIGGIRGNYNNVLAMERLHEQGCKPTLTEYETQERLECALRMGEVDAITFASVRGLSGGKVIEDLSTVDSYLVATRHDPALIEQVDYALAALNANSPTLLSDLETRYSGMGGGMMPSFTKAEADYIRKQGSVRVLIAPDEYDSSQTQLQSGSAQVLALFQEKTGLRFDPVLEGNVSDRLARFAAGEADLLFAMEHDYAWAQAHNCWLTAPYLKTPTIAVKRRDVPSARVIAVQKGSYMADVLRNRRDYDLLFCENIEQGLGMVLAGKADGLYCNQMQGNYFFTFPKYSALSFAAVPSRTDRACLGVSKSGDIILVSILNKALACMQEETLSSLLAGQPGARKLTAEDYYFTNPVASILALTGLVAGFVTILALLVFGAATRRKNRALQKATAAKTDFLSGMSHDMRTPMNAILGMTMLAEESDALSPELRDSLKNIELSSQYLLSLINDTLDMNKIEGNQMKLHLEPVVLAELWSSLLAVLQPLAHSAGVELILQAEELTARVALLDKMRVHQIFFNLLSNAIKFTPAGGHVSLCIHVLAVKGDIMETESIVRDDGIGISKEFMPRLFDPFEQEEQTIGAYGGTGLGLSITKNLVELMGGSIRAESEKGAGTRFILRLPCRVEPLRAEPVAEPVGELTGRRILLAEDHPLNIEVARRLLEKRGMLVETAGDGQQAVDLFSASELGYFDAILMDLRMPVLDGLAATQKIRALARADARTVPILAMTADAFNVDAEKTKAVGMNDHLTKPVEPEKLYRALWHCLEERKKNETRV